MEIDLNLFKRNPSFSRPAPGQRQEVERLPRMRPVYR
jgi:hypothetical protein